MRKIFLAVAAMAMLATACTKDDSALVGNESLVSFSVSSPELQTRYGEGSLATDLYYAFYDETGAILNDLSAGITDFSGSTTINVPLVEGRIYSAIFWADNAAAPYAVDFANKTMEITSTTFEGNSDKYDAFYKYEVNIDPKKKVHKIELTRPFAQINIATADTAAAKSAGVEVATSQVAVVEGYTTLNLLDGGVSNKATFTYTAAALPTDPATVTVGGKSYNMLAMNYVLVNNRELLEKVTLTMVDDDNKTLTREYTTVPVQRNYRTYIVGNLLTTNNDFEVETKPGFDGEEEYDGTHNVSVNGTNYNSFLEALNAAQAGDEISLNTDLTLAVGQTRSDASNYYAAIEGKDVTINLNGKNIFAKVPDVTKNSGIFWVKKGAKLTIKGEGNIHLKTSKAVNCLATFINNDAGTVDLVGDINWTIDALDYPDALIPCFVDNNSNVGNATLNIYAGTFTFHRNMFRNFANAASHNGYATVATINIYGGTFNGKADDAGAIWNQKPSASAPDGAGVINVYGGTFNNVIIDNDFEVGVNQKTPQQAFNEAAAAANGEPIYLAPAEGGYTLPSFSGHDINVVGVGEGVVLNMQDKTPGVYADVNIENVEIVFSNNNYKGFQHTGAEYYKNCTIVGQPFLYGENVVFDECTFEQTSANAYNVWTYSAKNVTFNGCTFNSAGKSVLVYHEGGISQNVTFNDCELNASAPVAGKAAVEIDSSFPNGGAGHYTININNTTANGFALGSVSFNSLWNEKKGDNCTVYVDGVEQGKAVVESNEALNDALKAGATEVAVAAGEYTFPASSIKEGVTIKCEEGTVFTGTSSLNIKGATVEGATFSNPDGQAVSGTINGNFKDCTFEGSEALRWCYTEAGKTSVFENCVIKTDLRGFHFDGLEGDVIFRNCEINGFNAYGGEGTVTFEGCTFGNDESKYNGLNIYANTVLKGCTFNYVSGKTNFIDMEGTGKTLTIENCTATLDGAAADVKDFVGGSQLANNTVIYK